MRRVSLKRAALNRRYTITRKGFLVANPVCQRCQAARATDVHHRTNRSQSSQVLLDVESWAALCRDCHTWVTDNPQLAHEEGWTMWGWEYRANGGAA